MLQSKHTISQSEIKEPQTSAKKATSKQPHASKDSKMVDHLLAVDINSLLEQVEDQIDIFEVAVVQRQKIIQKIVHVDAAIAEADNNLNKLQKVIADTVNSDQVFVLYKDLRVVADELERCLKKKQDIRQQETDEIEKALLARDSITSIIAQSLLQFKDSYSQKKETLIQTLRTEVNRKDGQVNELTKTIKLLSRQPMDQPKINYTNRQSFKDQEPSSGIHPLDRIKIDLENSEAEPMNMATLLDRIVSNISPLKVVNPSQQIEAPQQRIASPPRSADLPHSPSKRINFGLEPLQAPGIDPSLRKSKSFEVGLASMVNRKMEDIDLDPINHL